MKPLRVLLTNDDGVDSPGLQFLETALQAEGMKVCTVAPRVEQSAQSHAITLRRPLHVHIVRPHCHAVEGTPADCVVLALFALMDHRPDLVISGINHEYNLGEDVFYSGTVAAAREAAIYNIPALAVSMERSGPPYHYATAWEVVKRILEVMVPTERFFFLNINVPNRPLKELHGIRWTRLGTRVYRDPVRRNPDGTYTIAGTPSWAHENGVDLEAVLQGYASVTPLSLDLTDHDRLDALRQRYPF